MLRSRRLISLSAVLLIALTTQGRGAQSSMKGYELYSWNREGQWYYSILTGTNRAKTYEEITSSKVALEGTKGLKAGLKNLPKGETIFWMSAENASISSAHKKEEFRFGLPSGKRIKRIKKICDELGLKLELR
jgi:hypothetical protein